MAPETERLCLCTRSAHWLPAALLLVSCVATDPGANDVAALCAMPRVERPPNDSAVLVHGSLREAGELDCSGIALTPRLVLSNVLCLVLPAELDLSDLDMPLGRPSFDGIPGYTGDVDYTGSCASAAGWGPTEDGSFAAWLGASLEPSSFTVQLLRDGQLVASSSVRRVWFPHAGSRCWDTLAALVLEEPLDVTPRAVRLEETSRVGESITLSAFGPSLRVPLERLGEIEAITDQAGDASAPPRSLLLSKQVCNYEPGGGVLSAETGAAIGVIAFGTGDECGDPEGRTIATRIAPFRRLLLDAAQDAGESLPIEPPTQSAEPVPACPIE